MYIKNTDNRKSGYVLLESIVILMVVACICMFLNKIVVNNYLKYSVIYTRDDIKTLNEVEELVLIDAMNKFNNGEKQPFEFEDPSKEIKKTIITIEEGSATLIKEKGTNGKAYLDLECKKNVGVKETIKLVPKLYRTDYIVE